MPSSNRRKAEEDASLQETRRTAPAPSTRASGMPAPALVTPGSRLTPAMALGLQHRAGNRAVVGLIDAVHVQTVKNSEPRPAGISARLARNRFDLKNRKGIVSFRDWKRGYEAQHIIPYAVARKLGMPLDQINDAWNGMMLPSGRKRAAAAIYKAAGKFKTLPRHILKGWSHPVYSALVEKLCTDFLRLQKAKEWTHPLMIRVARYVRVRTKAMRGSQAIDQMASLDARKM